MQSGKEHSTCKGLVVSELGSDFIGQYPNQHLFHPDFLFALAPSHFQALRSDTVNDPEVYGIVKKMPYSWLLNTEGTVKLAYRHCTNQLPPSASAQIVPLSPLIFLQSTHHHLRVCLFHFSTHSIKNRISMRLVCVFVFPIT